MTLFATFETKPSLLSAASREHPRSSHHHHGRGWDCPDCQKQRMGTVNSTQTELCDVEGDMQLQGLLNDE